MSTIKLATSYSSSAGNSPHDEGGGGGGHGGFLSHDTGSGLTENDKTRASGGSELSSSKQSQSSKMNHFSPSHHLTATSSLTNSRSTTIPSLIITDTALPSVSSKLSSHSTNTIVGNHNGVTGAGVGAGVGVGGVGAYSNYRHEPEHISTQHAYQRVMHKKTPSYASITSPSSSNSSASPNSISDFTIPSISSPTYFNTKNHLTNRFALPQEIKSMKVTELTKDFLVDQNTVVIDVRPYTSYLASRLVNSLNVCVPTTLLKRKTFVLKNIIGSMHKSQQEYINAKLANNSAEKEEKLTFLLYDDNSSADSCAFHLYQICLKILDSIHTNPTAKNWSINILNHGISEIDTKNDADVSSILDSSHDPVISPSSPLFSETLSSTKSKTSPCSSKSCISATTPASSSFGGFASLSAFSLPPTSDFSSSFANSIKRSTGSSVDLGARQSESDIVHLPKNNHLSNSTLPGWLKPLLDPKAGFKLIQERFVSIEEIENVRLQNVAKLSTTSNMASKPSIPGGCSHCCSGSDGVCSPSAPCSECDQISYTLPEGVEFGDKNRYSNIWPYEHSRVKVLNSPLALDNASKKDMLTTTTSNDSSKTKNYVEYFNGNYVTVPRISNNRYIATQAPLPSTFNDFWRAVWYNGVEIIICLTNLEEGGVRKSDYYWKDSKFESGIELKLIDTQEEKSLNAVVRTIQLQKFSSNLKDLETKLIKQIEYRDWPDFGLPPSPESIINLVTLKNSFVQKEIAPIVVHCSAGCGRTGTFITVDVLLEMLWKAVEAKCHNGNPVTPLVRQSSLRSPFGQLDRQLLSKNNIGKNGGGNGDNEEVVLKKKKFWGDDDLIYKTVNLLRRQRLSMVQTLNQYAMCYETILAAINDACIKGTI